jgi:hypothetical protein
MLLMASFMHLLRPPGVLVYSQDVPVKLPVLTVQLLGDPRSR